MKRIPSVAAMFFIGWCAASAEAGNDPEHYTAEALNADLDQLYETLKIAHADLFIEVSEAAYDAEHARIREQLDSRMARDEVLALFQQFVAFGRVAHARIEEAAAAFERYREAGGAYLPLSVRIREGRAFVDAYRGSVLQPGDEILAIDEMQLPALLRAMRRHQSADTDYLAHTMLEWQFPRLLWQLFPERKTFRARFRRDGEVLEATLPTLTRAQSSEIAESRPADDRLELSWTEREFRLIDDSLGYLRPGPFYNVKGDALWDNAKFVAFIDDAFGQLIEKRVPALVIDIRDNPGGDVSFSDPMIAWFADKPFGFSSHFEVRVSQPAIEANAKRLASGNDNDTSKRYAREYATREAGETFRLEMPRVEPREGERYPGDVYVLVNRRSFSNATTAAALVQDHDFATVIGEETADLATTLGAMEDFTLDNTGIVVGFPKAMIVRASGDERRRGVVPDIAIETPLIETADDPVLTKAIAIIEQRSEPSAWRTGEN